MTQRSRGFLCLIAVILISLSFSGCGKKQEMKGIRLKLDLIPPSITDFLYVKMNYEFAVSPEFKGLSDDFKIYVHFWRPKANEMLMGDDHSPELPFSQWKAGETIRYSRVIFIPKFLDEADLDFEGLEKVNLSVGFHNPTVKDSKVELFHQVLDVQAASLNAPEMVYEEGWFQPETNLSVPNPANQNWRWTTQKAVCTMENPKTDSLLEIRGGVNKEKAPDQKVIIKINEQVLEEFIPETSEFAKKYILSKDMLGNGDELKLFIETDKTFIPKQSDPASTDDRELGVQVFFLYFRENFK